MSRMDLFSCPRLYSIVEARLHCRRQLLALPHSCSIRRRPMLLPNSDKGRETMHFPSLQISCRIHYFHRSQRLVILTNRRHRAAPIYGATLSTGRLTYHSRAKSNVKWRSVYGPILSYSLLVDGAKKRVSMQTSSCKSYRCNYLQVGVLTSGQFEVCTL